MNLEQAFTIEDLMQMGIFSDDERKSHGFFSIEEIELMQNSNETEKMSSMQFDVDYINKIPALIIAMDEYGNIGRNHNQHYRW